MKKKWLNTELSFEERAGALVSEMTLEEKISQLRLESEKIERLGVERFRWRDISEADEDVNYGKTFFPRSIGMAASFNEKLFFEVADAISDLARARFNEAKTDDSGEGLKTLTFWQPDLTIFGDPRWESGQESYGEDPLQVARMGEAFCKGLEGKDEKYLKTVPVMRDFSFYMVPPGQDSKNEVPISEKDLNETYFSAFRDCVERTNAQAIYCSGIKTDKETNIRSKIILLDILRNRWRFDGIVLCDFNESVPDAKDEISSEENAQSWALALKSGCDINLGSDSSYLLEAFKKGLIEEKFIDMSVYRCIIARMKLGLIAPEGEIAFSKLSLDTIDWERYRAISLQMVTESLVLLKNNNTLPFNKDNIKTVALIGPAANSAEALVGMSVDKPEEFCTLLEGLREAIPDVQVIYAKGCSFNGAESSNKKGDELDFTEALAAAEQADAVIIATGSVEGIAKKYSKNTEIKLSYPQEELINEITAIKKPAVLVNMTGGCVDLSVADEKCDAIIQAWHPGQFGGKAIADVLFGVVPPSGRLPITFYKEAPDLSDIKDHAIGQRTYRFYQGKPIYPFGHGLSYGKVEYYDICLSTNSISEGQEISCSVKCINRGKAKMKETVQVYLRDDHSSVRVPKYNLMDFKKITLYPNKEEELSFTINASQISVVSEKGEKMSEPGTFTLFVGGSQPDMRSSELVGYDPLSAKFLFTE